jgi:hypothetical protein
MALRAERAGGRGVLGAAVMRTAVEVGAAAVVVDSLDRRQAAKPSPESPESDGMPHRDLDRPRRSELDGSTGP